LLSLVLAGISRNHAVPGRFCNDKLCGCLAPGPLASEGERGDEIDRQRGGNRAGADHEQDGVVAAAAFEQVGEAIGGGCLDSANVVVACAQAARWPALLCGTSS
jgi:hypothetical protein